MAIKRQWTAFRRDGSEHAVRAILREFKNADNKTGKSLEEIVDLRNDKEESFLDYAIDCMSTKKSVTKKRATTENGVTTSYSTPSAQSFNPQETPLQRFQRKSKELKAEMEAKEKNKLLEEVEEYLWHPRVQAQLASMQEDEDLWVNAQKENLSKLRDIVQDVLADISSRKE